MISLTSPIIGGKLLFIPGEELKNMKGGVYRHRDKWRVYFKGDWFFRDEHGQLLYDYRHGLNFLEHLNALYKGKAYDPSRFKSKSPHKFDQAFQNYLDLKQTDSEWNTSKKHYWERFFKPFFKNIDIREIQQIHLQEFVNWLYKKNFNGKYVKNVLSVVHAFLNYYRASIPVFPPFPQVTYQRKAIRWMNEQETNQIFEFIEPEDKGFFTFLRTYGCRPSEAAGLRRDKIIWETGDIVIDTVWVERKLKSRTKTKRVHYLPIIPEIVEYLKPQKDSMFIFLNQQGIPYSKNMWNRRWNRAWKQANEKYGTRKMTVYNLRHSWASQRRRDGWSLELIGKGLGHSDLRTTEAFYADIGSHELIEIVRGKK